MSAVVDSVKTESAASDALVSRITAVRLSLRPSEQRVAAYVLGQPNRVAKG